MNSWKVENPNRLLTEVKNKLSEIYSVKDLKWSLEHNRCFVNDTIEIFGSFPLKKGDKITFFPEKKPSFVIEKSRILYEDDHLFIYDKPPYIPSEKLALLTNTLLVHRLDRDTTGIILLAKTEKVQKELEKHFKERVIYKEYLALVEGYPGEQGVIQEKMAPIKKREGAIFWGISLNGFPSKTLWRSTRRDKKTTLVRCRPITGRTHQIRVHFKHIGHPLVGDFVYGSKHKGMSFRPLLHAARIKFFHPEEGRVIEINSIPGEQLLRQNQ